MPLPMLNGKVGAALGLAVLLGGLPAASAAERLAQIPVAFQGRWMAQLRQCQAGPGDESWLRIEAGQISFYESRGPVLAVVGRGGEELAVITELSGEGSTWLQPLRLLLDGTAQRLAVEMTGVEGSMERVRCPGP